MPRQKLNPAQRRLWNQIRKGISTVDDLSEQMYREILDVVRTYGTATLTVADQRVIMQAIERILDNVYGLSRNTAPRSRMYRAIVRELDTASMDVYKDAYKQLERTVTRSKGAATWQRIDTQIRFAKPTKAPSLTTVRRAMDDDPVAKTRLLRSRSLDAQRRWVPKDRWTTKEGYRLSDRLWKISRETRDAIDEQIREAIRKGTDPIKLAKELEEHLNGASKSRTIYRANGTIAKRVNQTAAPRNGWGNTSARRLARTEISRVNAAATVESSKVVPGIIGVRYLTSNRHPESDGCDGNAAGHSEGLPIGVYTYDQMPTIPAHSNCLCVAAHYSAPSEQVVDDIVKRYLPNG